MDATQVLEQIKDSGVAPAEVWFISTIVLTSILIAFIAILIFFVKNFFQRLQLTIDGFQESIDKLTKITERHDWEIDAIKERQSKPRRWSKKQQ